MLDIMLALSAGAYLWSLKVEKIVPFSYLQVAISTTKCYMTQHEYLHTKVSVHARDQHEKEKTYFFCSFVDCFCKKIFSLPK